MSVSQHSNSSYSNSSYHPSPQRDSPEQLVTIFPASLLRRRILKTLQFKGMTDKAAVYMSAVLEYLCAELLDMSSEVATSLGVAKITPTHILKAIRQDEEMSRLLKGVEIPWIEYSQNSSAVQSQIEDEGEDVLYN